MSALKKLLLGETWWLPLGIALVVAGGGLLLRPLAGDSWPHIGGFILLAGVLCVLVTSVARSSR